MPEHPTALFHDVAAIALAQPGAEPGAMMGSLADPLYSLICHEP